MQRKSPTPEPLSRNFLDETFVWILPDEKERQALRSHTRPTDLPPTELEHCASRSGDLPGASIARGSELVRYKRTSVVCILCLPWHGWRCDACPVRLAVAHEPFQQSHAAIELGHRLGRSP
jgi:hypothetical protein